MSDEKNIIGAESLEIQGSTAQNEKIDCGPKEFHHLFPRQFWTVKINYGKYQITFKKIFHPGFKTDPTNPEDPEDPGYKNLVKLNKCRHRLLFCRGKNLPELPHEWIKSGPGVHTNSRIPKIKAIKNGSTEPTKKEIDNLARNDSQHNWNKDWKDFLLRFGKPLAKVTIRKKIKKMCDTYQIPRP